VKQGTRLFRIFAILVSSGYVLTLTKICAEIGKKNQTKFRNDQEETYYLETIFIIRIEL